MLWEAFASAGCGIDIKKRPVNITDRRSLPHAHEWPNLATWIWRMIEQGYEPHPIFILRDWNATIKSVMGRDANRKQNEVERNMTRALAMMGAVAAEYHNSIYVTYEAFCLEEGFRRWLFCDKLFLREPEIEIKYANRKYYE